MRKIYLLFIFSIGYLFSTAQTISEEAAKALVTQYSAAAGLSKYDVENFKVSSAYKDEISKAYLIYI